MQIEIIGRLGDVLGLSEFNWLVAVIEKYV